MHKLLPTLLITALALTPFTGFAQTSVTNNFFVESSFDFAARDKVSSTLRHESQNAYFYVEDSVYNSLPSSQKQNFSEQLSTLANEFDTNIYPRLRSVYGPELSPGIDNDTKITILFTRMRSSSAGYFLERNQLSRSQDPLSNEREMFYINADTVLDSTAKVHVAHEFVHLIEYNQRTLLRQKQERWLSEGLADYAPTLLGYNSSYSGSYLETRARDFLSFPSNSLLNWKETPVDIAASSMFTHYLVGQYGTGVITEIMRAPVSGEEGVTRALSVVGSTDTFRDTFTNWNIANYINSSGKYAYRTAGLNFSNFHITTPLQYSIFQNSAITTNFFVDYGAASWLRFVPGQLGTNGANVLRLEFDSSQSSGSFEVPYIVTDITGRSVVRFMDMADSKDIVFIDGFGTSVISVVIAPSNYYTSLFLNPPAGSFTIKVNTVTKAGLPAEASAQAGETGRVNGDIDYADGALLRAIGDPKVYVIKKACPSEASCEGGTPCQSEASCVGWKRWIPTAEIFEQYGHLRWQDIIDVQPAVLDAYEESRLIKFIGDYRVYELNSTHTLKQWLNITPATFESRGYNWNQIYEVNAKEYNFYQTSTPIN
ncbi:MAG: hypothetical protein WDZ40_01825 [Candidatus Spechtbacterales bacterium]